MSQEHRNQDLDTPAFRRAILPEVLLVPDLALARGTGISATQKAVLRGECGAYFYLGRRLAIRREEFLRACAARETAPLPQAAPARPLPPKPNDALLAELRRPPRFLKGREK